VIDDWMFRVCRRRSAERDALSVSQEEHITHLDGPVIFRSAPRPADGGIPRFATQAEADAALADAMECAPSEEMTWEE
jgi:hypothetical protein